MSRLPPPLDIDPKSRDGQIRIFESIEFEFRQFEIQSWLYFRTFAFKGTYALSPSCVCRKMVSLLFQQVFDRTLTRKVPSSVTLLNTSFVSSGYAPDLNCDVANLYSNRNTCAFVEIIPDEFEIKCFLTFLEHSSVLFCLPTSNFYGIVKLFCYLTFILGLHT